METIRLTCPKCSRHLFFAAKEVGRLGRCSGCGHGLRIPNPAAEVQPTVAPVVSEPEIVEIVACPSCGKENYADDILCAYCGQRLQTARRLPDKSSAVPKREFHVRSSFLPLGAVLELRYAGFWRRFLAAFIDGIVLFAIGFIVGLAIVSIGGPSQASAYLNRDGQGVESLAWAVVAWLYFALLESSSMQGTLGKRAIGIAVTDMQGKRIGFGRATGRHFAKIISALMLGIGYLLAGFTEKKQALHDMLASCLVVKRN